MQCNRRVISCNQELCLEYRRKAGGRGFRSTTITRHFTNYIGKCIKSDGDDVNRKMMVTNVFISILLNFIVRFRGALSIVFIFQCFFFFNILKIKFSCSLIFRLLLFLQTKKNQ